MIIKQTEEIAPIIIRQSTDIDLEAKEKDEPDEDAAEQAEDPAQQEEDENRPADEDTE